MQISPIPTLDDGTHPIRTMTAAIFADGVHRIRIAKNLLESRDAGNAWDFGL